MREYLAGLECASSYRQESEYTNIVKTQIMPKLLNAKQFVFSNLTPTLHSLMPGLRLDSSPEERVIKMKEFHSLHAPSVLAIPFQTIFIEHSSNEGFIANMTFNEGAALVKGLLVHEIAPATFQFWSLAHLLVKKAGYKTEWPYVWVAGDSDWPDHTKICSLILYSAMEAINKDKLAQASVNTKVKVKHNGENVFHKIRKIIYVCPKGEQKSFNPCNSHDVDWSHRWLVRGHWRKHTGLGKDREGRYCITGHTWVTEHEKGPDGLPLIGDKVRYVKSQEVV